MTTTTKTTITAHTGSTKNKTYKVITGTLVRYEARNITPNHYVNDLVIIDADGIEYRTTESRVIERTTEVIETTEETAIQATKAIRTTNPELTLTELAKVAEWTRSNTANRSAAWKNLTDTERAEILGKTKETAWVPVSKTYEVELPYSMIWTIMKAADARMAMKHDGNNSGAAAKVREIRELGNGLTFQECIKVAQWAREENTRRANAWKNMTKEERSEILKSA